MSAWKHLVWLLNLLHTPPISLQEFPPATQVLGNSLEERPSQFLSISLKVAEKQQLLMKSASTLVPVLKRRF